MIVLMGRTKGISGYMADRRPVTGGGGGGGGEWGIYLMGNRVNRLGNSPFSPIFSRIFLRSIGCIFIDQYFRVEVKKQDNRLISSV